MASTLKSLAICAVLFGATSHPAFATSGKYRITSAEKAACIADATRFCAHTYPDEDKLLSCMRLNHDALSEVCRSTFDAGLKRRRL